MINKGRSVEDGAAMIGDCVDPQTALASNDWLEDKPSAEVACGFDRNGVASNKKEIMMSHNL